MRPNGLISSGIFEFVTWSLVLIYIQMPVQKNGGSI